MRKQIVWTFGALGLLVLALALYGCDKGGDSPTAPARTGSPTTTAPTASNDAPTVEPTPAPEEDASGGRALSASFTSENNPWPAKLVNTTHNDGTVSYCVYDLRGPGGWANQGDPVHSKAFRVPARSELEVDIYDVYNPAECVLEIISFECDLQGEPGEGEVTCKAESNMPAQWSAEWTQAMYASDVMRRTSEPTTKVEFSAKLPRGLATLALKVEAYAVCGDELIFQADLIRGPECGQAPANHAGYNFDYVYGTLEESQRSEVQASREWNFECVPEPVGEPVVEVEYDEWGECQEPTGLDASDVQRQCMRQRKVTTTTTQHFTCDKEPEVEVEVTYESEPCECPCVEEWIEDEEPEITEGEWGECLAVEDDQAAAELEEDIMGLVSTSTDEPEVCWGEHSRTDLYTWYEVNTCTQERRISRTDEKLVSEPCEIECPYAEGFCFYNISRQPKAITCQTKLGGSPLRLGEWGRWPDGPPSDHCRFTVPGIYSDPFRQFQLTPGQSDPRCNSY